MKRKNRISPSKLPIILNVQDIKYLLRIGESAARSLFKREDFPKLEIMKRDLVLKDSFFEWLEKEDEKNGR
ncbi:MAG: DNA-binding protein [Clostridia bacterium]|nr:DNA-binding protein [Clostridia bacterium]